MLSGRLVCWMQALIFQRLLLLSLSAFHSWISLHHSHRHRRHHHVCLGLDLVHGQWYMRHHLHQSGHVHLLSRHSHIN
jgi:hypothetical protein